MAHPFGRSLTFDIRAMLELRAMGVSYSELGRKFHKDHTTIMHHCVKYGVYPSHPATTEVPAIKWQYYVEPEPVYEAPVPKYAHLIEEDAGRNKTYKQYLAESLARKAEKHFSEKFGSEASWSRT